MLQKLASRMAVILLSLLMATPVFAAYPDKPVTLVVPFGAGGAVDVPARLLGNMMEKKLGQTIVVQNIVGAAGTQGAAQVVTANPDGYTLGYFPTGVVCLQPHVQNVPYGRDSFTLLGMTTRQPVVLMSSQKAPWKDFKEMVEIVKKEPDTYVVAITGTGNMTHIPVLELAKHFGLKFRYIPYRTTPEVMKDMLTGRVALYADSPVPLSQFDVFGLIQFADARADNLNFPTTKEMGYDGQFLHWQGVFAPKDLPADVTERLAQVIQEVVQSPEFAAEMSKMSSRAHWLGVDEFRRFFEKEFDMYGVVLKEIMAKPQ
ncbi:MAG: tripartite tricarboxylate transporter substrate binding protein [Desulfovibrionaceae bacterium]|nr:tripartite tricarboxylate transporter substrate binding protein [Desulfovibrionaceae bacterium]